MTLDAHKHDEMQPIYRNLRYGLYIVECFLFDMTFKDQQHHAILKRNTNGQMRYYSPVLPKLMTSYL